MVSFAKVTKHKPILPSRSKVIRGSKYKYPTTTAGKKKLFARALKYMKSRREGKKIKRNYMLEYFYYGSRPEVLKRTNIRVKHRGELIKQGKIRRHDGTEVDHTNPSTLDFRSIVIRKSRCAHNAAWGNSCRNKAKCKRKPIYQ